MKKYTYHTVTTSMLADLYTPVSVYLKMRDAYPQSALMECSDYHSVENARSFICLEPIGSVAFSHGVCVTNYPDGHTDQRPIDDDLTPAVAINDFLNAFSVTGEGSEFCGVYGYTSFNAVRYFENIPVKDETMERNDAPDLYYILYKYVIVFDHFSNRMTIVALVDDDVKESRLPACADKENNDPACADKENNDPACTDKEGRLPACVQRLIHDIVSKPIHTYPFHAIGLPTSTLTDDEHRENIRRGIAHCLRGDVFQIVLSRRFVQRYDGDDFNLYRSLRSINPSPYLFYFDFGNFRIFGSSPETHCRITRSDDGKYRAYIDPIAGTTRRTGNQEQDRKNALYLRNDPKENAEHVMLVDLARNDLSRNCHDVRVDFYKDMQFYSHVIHLVSRVSGELDQGADPIKAFIDTFPAGTLSGAPKVRAMQLISQYEPHNRGAYGGCIGFIGFDRTLNQAITIRTFVARNGELWFQAGGGIVAKSDVEYELQEVNNKLGALRKAIELTV